MSLTIQQRGEIARRAHMRLADERAAIMRRLMEVGGMGKKRAAYFVGVSERTALRYERRACDAR